MQNSSFINSSFKRVVFSKLFHKQFAAYFTKQCYLALFFYAIKLSQTYLVDVLFVLCQSNPTTQHKQNCHKLSTISKTLTPYISTFFLTRIYNENFHSGKTNMLTLPKKFFLSIFTFTKQITMRSQWVCSPFFLPWHLSSSNSQHKRRGLPMVSMLERRKALNLLIIHQQGLDQLGRLPTRKAQNLCSQENPYPACIHFHLEDELRTAIKMRKLKNPLV